MIMKKLYLFLFLIFFSFLVFPQDEIKSQSESKTINFEPEYKRGLPPELTAEISFEDANKNNIFEANEYAILKIKLGNNGLGPAQGIYVNIKDKSGKGIEFTDTVSTYFIYPNQIKEYEIPVIASVDLKTAKHNIEIEINEQFGYDVDPINLYIQTLEYQSPKLVFSGLEVLDSGDGVMSVIEDGKVQPGELVKVRLYVQNVGLNIARQSEFEIYTKDANIYLANQEGALGNFEIGEVKEIEFNMSPNKRININESLDVYLNLKENTGDGSLADFKLPIEINKRPKQAEIIDVAANIDDLKSQVKKFELHNKNFKTKYGELVDVFNIPKREVSRENAVGVIIGVEDYLNLPPAPYALNDATLIERYFKELLGINEIVFLTNKDVAGLAFDDIFNPDYGELQKSVIKSETELFVFYSGHGIPNKSGSDVYLFPHDGKIERVELQGYSLSKLYNSLDKLQAKRVTLFLDACFSGASKTSETVEMNNLVSMKGVRIKPKLPKPWENNENFIELQKSVIKSETELFVFYSGHGIPNKSGSDVYLFPHDGKIERVELQGYSLSKLYNSLDKLQAKRVTLFLDACFSGASKTSETVEMNNLVSMKGVRIKPKLPKPWENNENFIVFNSSSYSETSLAFDETHTGLFTYYLCAGLSGEADFNTDNQISLGELKDYVIDNVQQTSKKIFGLQTPEFHGNEDYIILNY